MTNDQQQGPIGTAPFDERRCINCGRFLKPDELEYCGKCLEEEKEDDYYNDCLDR